jgi:hypothetical protein
MSGPVIQLDQFTSLLTEVEAEPRLARRFARVAAFMISWLRSVLVREPLGRPGPPGGP